MASDTKTPQLLEDRFVETIARELGIQPHQVRAADALFGEGATLPFIARYRKEATGGVVDEQLEHLLKRRLYFLELIERRDAILASVAEQEKLTDELEAKIRAAETKQELEDLYLPFKAKRRTRAQVARERGLEPLADAILAAASGSTEAASLAGDYLSEERGVPKVDDALAGARDILAERIAESAEQRGRLREVFAKESTFRVKVIPGQEAEGAVFRDYFDHSEPLVKAPSHRLLAILRGEREGVLVASLDVDDEREIALLSESWSVPLESSCGQEIQEATRDGYKRLLRPSIANEVRSGAKERAEAEAIRVFRDNLEALLMQAPLGQLPVMGIDPGYRTGCKVCVVDRTGRVVSTATIYPTPPRSQPEQAARTIRKLTAEHGVRAVAIGNGTGSRETELFVRRILKPKAGDSSDSGKTNGGTNGGGAKDAPAEHELIVAIVPETGASVYSASPIAREELPDLDVSLRGAASIARRLQDPLAELVKIEPKSLGVGQYQHDVNQKSLGAELDLAVEGVVNRVGVELNTASSALLERVAGLSGKLARKVVSHRDEKGAFADRHSLLDVSGFGPKSFEQSAGFLRIRSDTPTLDATSVHPERYELVERMASELGVGVQELVGSPGLIAKLDLTKFVDEASGVGQFTLDDIRAELERPGRDPRPDFEAPAWRDDVQSLEDLEVEMILEGRISNVTNFGAFVDIGVKRDGLVHLSELSHTWVEDPREVVKVGQIVKVKVMEVDADRKRITLSMKALAEKPAATRSSRSRRSGGPKPEGGSGSSRRGGRSKKPAPRSKARTGDGPARKSAKSAQASNRPAREEDVQDLLDKFKRRW